MSRKKNKPEINTKEKQEKTEIKIEKVIITMEKNNCEMK